VVNVVNIGVNVAIRLIARNPLKTKGWVHVVHVVHVVELCMRPAPLTWCRDVFLF